jgi:hypothetical protein
MDGPYPNPVSGAGISSIDVILPAASTIGWSVFTTAFRMIKSGTLSASAGKTIIQWDLKDKNESPVADGIYYIRIYLKDSSTTKIFKVLVLR